MRNDRTFKTALGGICLALAVVFMFAGSFFPGIEMTLFAVSSFFTAVMIIETGVKGGLMLYAGAVILGMLIVPGKHAVLLYASFFGYYGILKYLIEKLRSGAVQVLLKTAFFAAVCISLLTFAAKLLADAVSLPDLPLPLLIPAGVLFLLLYDYIFTLFINFFLKHSGRQGRSGFRLS